MERVNFEAGEPLMTEGESGEEFFIIVEGKCNVLVGTIHVTKVAILTAGDYCGEVCYQYLFYFSFTLVTMRYKNTCTNHTILNHFVFCFS